LFLRGVMRIVVAGAAIFLGLFSCGRNLLRAAAADGPSGAASTPVLVELFTSEGCSDCPPADALLAKLEKTQPVPGANIIILEEHVTYWDQLGWKDPFSFREMTSRQASYADAFGGQQVYTPQMIVDGQAEFVGSSAAKANQAIRFAAVSHKAAINLQWSADGKLMVAVSPLPGLATGDKSDVYLAVTESALHSDVRRGENAGRALEHDGVVRQLDRVGTIDGPAKNFNSTLAMHPAKEWNRANLRAVVFVQDQQGFRVLAAAQIPFPAL
jgi:hypothetical protein